VLYRYLCGAWLLGVFMKARQLIANASYDPDQLKALGKAFDDAWGRISPNVSARPPAIEASRLKLAEIILSLAKQRNFDPAWLADSAVQMMLAPPRKLRP
jgi:hypothetical protein